MVPNILDYCVVLEAKMLTGGLARLFLKGLIYGVGVVMGLGWVDEVNILFWSGFGFYWNMF